MRGWAHTITDTVRHVSCSDCCCSSPDPDPTSLCGQRDHPKGLPCGAPERDDWHDRRFWENEPELWHAYQPTRCTCGHPIEPVP